MTTRRSLLKLTAFIAVGGFVGWEIYRQRPLPKHEDWRLDYQKGSVELVNDWILSTTEANNRP